MGKELALRKQVRVKKDILAPHFYIIKLEFTRVYIFLIFTLKHRLCLSTIYVSSKNMKILKKKKKKKKKKKNKQPKIVIFTAVKNRCMLHGRVFVI